MVYSLLFTHKRQLHTRRDIKYSSNIVNTGAELFNKCSTRVILTVVHTLYTHAYVAIICSAVFEKQINAEYMDC